MLVPNAYIHTLLEKTQIETIHLGAEQELLGLQVKRYEKEYEINSGSLRGIERRLNTVKPPAPLRTAEQRRELKKELARFIDMKVVTDVAMDSVRIAADKLDEVNYKQRVASIHLREKLEIANLKIGKIKTLLALAVAFLLIGFVMATYGFAWWGQKEGMPRLRIGSPKKPTALGALSTGNESTVPNAALASELSQK